MAHLFTDDLVPPFSILIRAFCVTERFLWRCRCPPAFNTAFDRYTWRSRIRIGIHLHIVVLQLFFNQKVFGWTGPRRHSPRFMRDVFCLKRETLPLLQLNKRRNNYLHAKRVAGTERAIGETIYKLGDSGNKPIQYTPSTAWSTLAEVSSCEEKRLTCRIKALEACGTRTRSKTRCVHDCWDRHGKPGPFRGPSFCPTGTYTSKEW